MITPELWQRVKGLLAPALQRQAADRKRFGSRATEDTAVWGAENLIFARSRDPSETFTDELFAGANDGSLIGTRVGAYEIVRELGRGGMGVVYLAARIDREFEKNVAIKVLRRGTDTDEVLRRFRGERKILARLDHPNIARLIDAGTTKDGLPYFVTEYMDGLRINDFCEAEKLSVRDRVKLFLAVCSAVHFGHRNLILHRDLKPENVLVTSDGEPKLLDFGIIKLIAPEGDVTQMTLEDRAWLTAGYASPEEVRCGPVTTASDVYSLGALLYDLLTGAPPHQFSTPPLSAMDLFRTIVEQEPPRASSVARTPEERRQLRGDLDNILRTALRKEPERRYSGVIAFTEDLRRYLDRRPVRARKDAITYLASKFIQRNKLGFAAAMAIVMGLIGGIAATVWQAREAGIARERAEQRFAELRKLAHTVLFEYYELMASLPGSTSVRQRLVKDSAEYLDNLSREAGGDRDLMRELATAYHKLGQVQGDLYHAKVGDGKDGIASYSKSLEIRMKLLAADPDNRDLEDEAAISYEGVGDMHYAIGDLQSGLQNYERSLELREQLVTSASGNVSYRMALADLYEKLGEIKGMEGHANLGDTAGALAACRKAQELFESLTATEPRSAELKAKLANVLTHVGMLSHKVGDAAEALTTQRKAVAMMEESVEGNSSQSFELKLLTGRNLLRYALEDSGQVGAAVEQSRRNLAALEKMLSIDPRNSSIRRNISATCNALGRNLLATGNVAGAIENHRKALSISEAMLAADSGNDHKADVFISLGLLAKAQVANQEFRSALQNYRKALALSEAVLGADPSNPRAKEDVANIQADLGLALAATGNFEGAIGAFNKALPLAEQAATNNVKSRARLAQRHGEIGKIHMQFAQNSGGVARDARNEWRRAQDHFNQSLGIWRELREKGQLLPIDATQLDQVAHNLAACEAALRL